MSDFEPKIIAFLCNWCSYVAADAAGVGRFAQKPNVRVIRVFCSGMVDPSYVLKAFASGADGVLVGGCHPGDCHYLAGNIKALRRSFLLRKAAGRIGGSRAAFPTGVDRGFRIPPICQGDERNDRRDSSNGTVHAFKGTQVTKGAA